MSEYIRVPSYFLLGLAVAGPHFFNSAKCRYGLQLGYGEPVDKVDRVMVVTRSEPFGTAAASHLPGGQNLWILNIHEAVVGVRLGL